ncbi:MAG TPA: carboxypeptidase regulatory-like domain-containing protein [Bryobacteraceae bacterium]|nr:carboxypeptidase regulatory-like domain-containing protein [Bryobacteraceae bacterium]
MKKIAGTRISWLLIGVLLLAQAVIAQSLTTGEIAGVVRDSSNAVIQNATVTLKSLDTGTTQEVKTGAIGEYRFLLLKPGRYSVTAAAAGFQKLERTTEVVVGNAATVDMSLTVGQSTQTVEVTAEAPLVNTEASTNTSFTPQQLTQLPSAGGDITNIAYTAPGVVVNTTGGYGNFQINGLPATSNLYTVNGENDMDPYFNINNSGASNLTIGQNELQEATVIANPYGGQYGQLSGAQVTYVTKSGTNQFHGNAAYWWNGRVMNSNDWFNNYYGDSKPFSNANQWAASFGGPVRKDKTFFFVDTEGLRFVLPTVGSETVPTPAFANAVLTNVTNLEPAEASAYKTMLGLWDNAPGISSAQVVPVSSQPSSCTSVSLPGYNGATTPCEERFESSGSALGSEWILSFRADQKLGQNGNLFFRYKGDHGLQPTTIDHISPNFDALSNQPAYDMQLGETQVLSARATNNFTTAFSHYVAQFAQDPQKVASTFPYGVVTSGTVPFSGFNAQYDFPQGRNVTQYQFIDDFTLNRGAHSLKFGENFRRYDVSDHNFFFNNPGVYFGYTSNGLQNFVNGLAYQYRKTDNLAADVPIAMWGLGVYAEDDWSVASNVKLTLAFRVEHNSNPVCQFNCFANMKGDYKTLASFSSSNPGSVPYSADITPGQHQAYPGVDSLVYSPRIGFSWSPGGGHKTVVSGGFMLAYDNPAAGLVDDLLGNPPVAVALRVRPSAGILPFDPAGGAAVWQASANAFSLNETYGQISTALKALGATFSAPSVTSIVGTIHAPMVREWSLQLQRQVSNDLVFSMNYAGNSTTRLPYTNAWPNAYDEYGLYPGVPGIPSSPAVPNYLIYTQLQSGAMSNYNGLSFIVTKRMAHWVTAHFSYTFSHELDECSNGCLFGSGGAEDGGGQINPLGLRVDNYGNGSYDIRHSFVGDFLINPTFHPSSAAVGHIVNGWEFSGKVFWRSGLPFTVTDGYNSVLGNGGGAIFGTPLGKGWGQMSCGAAAAGDPGVATPCINSSVYLDSSTIPYFTEWSPATRNNLFGPHYFDMDLNLYRYFAFKERFKLGVGIQAFNALNHPNFGFPDATLGDGSTGIISSTVATTTSPYGSFLGFDNSVRVVQLSGKLTF